MSIDEENLKEILKDCIDMRSRWLLVLNYVRTHSDSLKDETQELQTFFEALIPRLQKALGLPITADLQIINAWYGILDESSVLPNSPRITSTIKDTVKDNALKFRVLNTTMGGDPAPGHVKTLGIQYRYFFDEPVREIRVQEGQQVNIVPPEENSVPVTRKRYRLINPQ